MIKTIFPIMKLILFFFIPISAIGQYSDYYTINHNINANVNKNVNVSGNVNKTITTIDYGALANANAQREKNRLEAQKLSLEQSVYRDEQARRAAILDANRAIEIAEDPMKAYTYGTQFSWNYSCLNEGWWGLKRRGFLSFTETITIPHKSLFENIGSGRWENISTDGITAEIISELPFHNFRKFRTVNQEQYLKYEARKKILLEYYMNNSKPRKKDYKKNKEKYKKDLDRYLEICDSLYNFGCWITAKNLAKMHLIEEKSMFLGKEGDSTYCHKKEIVKRTVYGKPGYRGTLIWEDDYEICITDNYISQGDTRCSVKVRYKADKNSGLTFEDLEGRRFYFSRLIDKLVAARMLTNEVYSSEDESRPHPKSYSNAEEWVEAHRKWRQYNP